MRRRILVSNILVILAVIISRPGSEALFFAGLAVAAAGEIIRLIASATIVKSKELTTAGIYSATRNPLYLGTFIIALGFLISITNLREIGETAFVWILMLAGFGGIYAKQIKREEKFLSEKYGRDWEEYRKNVNRIFPTPGSVCRIFRLSECSKEMFRRNKEYRGVFGLLIVFAIVYARIVINGI